MTLIIGFILGAVALVFIVQNIIPVTVTFLAWNFEGSLAIIILFALLGGMLISWLLSIPQMLRLSDLRRSNRKLLKDLDIHKEKLAETEGKLEQAKAPVVLEKTVVVDKNVNS